MTTLTAAQVAGLALAAGFKGEALVTAVAIAHAESSFDTALLGDVNLEDRTWGPSVGLWQIRSLKAQAGTGKQRDQNANLDPTVNARNAYAISNGGSNFRPWTTFTNGAYKQFIAEARSAGGAAVDQPITASTTSDGGSSVVAIPAPLPNAPAVSLQHQELIVGGTIDFTTTKPSELSIDFLDDGQTLLINGPYRLGYSFTYEGVAWTVTSIVADQLQGNLRKLTVHASPAGVVQLRLLTATSATDISPTDYMRQLAQQAGLGFVGGESASIGQIGPALVPDTSTEAVAGAQKQETGWDIGQRLASDLAKTQPWMMFEAGGTLFFGIPQYLTKHTRSVELSYASESRSPVAATKVDVQTGPTCEMTRTQTIGRSIIPRGVLITAGIDRLQGKALRPGQRTTVAGIPLFDGDYLMTRVGWNLVPNTGSVTVECGDFPAFPGLGEISTLIPAPATPVVHVPADGGASYFQQPRLGSDQERTMYFGRHGDRVRWTDYRTPWGITVQVNDLILSQFQAACRKAAHDSQWVPRVIGSIRDELIPGSSSYSLHAFGLAWDFFDTANPASPIGEADAPDAAFAAAFKALGFYLGRDFHHTGGFGNQKDWPHIEWASAPPSPEQKKTASLSAP